MVRFLYAYCKPAIYFLKKCSFNYRLWYICYARDIMLSTNSFDDFRWFVYFALYRLFPEFLSPLTILFSGNFSIPNNNTSSQRRILIFFDLFSICFTFFVKRVTGPFALRCLILTTRPVSDFFRTKLRGLNGLLCNIPFIRRYTIGKAIYCSVCLSLVVLLIPRIALVGSLQRGSDRDWKVHTAIVNNGHWIFASIHHRKYSLRCSKATAGNYEGRKA